MTKPNPENYNCSSKCAYDCAQLQYTIQRSTVLIISPLTARQPTISMLSSPKVKVMYHDLHL